MAKQSIFNPNFWAERLKDGKKRNRIHYSVFQTNPYRWELIENHHKDLLKKYIGDEESVFDCGCAYGRLYGMMPPTWKGFYCGMDLCPEFVEYAVRKYGNNPERGPAFLVGDLRDTGFDVDPPNERFDWAVLISIRGMVLREMGEEPWKEMEKEVKRVTKKQMYLEYSDMQPAVIEYSDPLPSPSPSSNSEVT